MPLILFIDGAIVFSLLAASRRRLEDALPLFCFWLIVMPFEARLVIPGVFDLSADRVAILTLVLLFVVKGARARLSPIPMKRLIIAHIGWLLCSTVCSLSVVGSTKQLLSQVLEYYILYIILFRTISERATVYRITYAMVVAMAVCSALGLFEAYASWSILSVFPANLWTTYGLNTPLYIEWGRGLRIRSTFPHPILFGDALAMSIPLALYLLSVWKRGWQRAALWAAVGLMFWGVYKTSSRGPWIAVVISCALLFVLVRNRVRRYLITIAGLAAVALLARPGIWETVLNLYYATYDSANPVGSSYQYRDALTEAVRQAVARDPVRLLFGYGLGTFRELGLFINFLTYSHVYYTCDNNWALFVYETGYGGLLIISALLFTPLWKAVGSYRRLPRPERYFSGVLVICLTAFYFLLLSVAGYSWGQQGFMAWVLISLSAIYPRVALKRTRGMSEIAERERLSPSLTAGPEVRSCPGGSRVVL